MKPTTGTTPANVWQALRRLRACNKQQLATALGISRHTLHRWEQMTEAGDSPGKAAEQAASELLIATLRAANGADVHAQWRINWDRLATIGDRK